MINTAPGEGIDAPTLPLPFDTGLACLVLIARLHGVSVDPGQLRHEFGESGKAFDAHDLLRAARWLGLKAKRLKSNWTRLAKTQLPAIACLNNGQFAVLAKLAEDTALVQDPRVQRPVAMTRNEFETHWSGELILMARRAGGPSERARFDFSWFIPAILKYKRFLGEVLLASFFIQLFALVTPLFFQVVIDKVLVH